MQKREKQIIIRVTPEEKEGFEQAAELLGSGLSEWARQKLRDAAIKELQGNGDSIPFFKTNK